MESAPRVVAFVPAKGTSDRVPGKNLRRIGGQTLVARKIGQLMAVPEITEVWLDTDSEEIADACAGLGCKVLWRPRELASNDTDGNQLFRFEAESCPEADIVVQALCTAPFLGPAEMSAALQSLIASDNDSLFCATESKNYAWSGETPNYDLSQIPNSSDLDSLVIETMSFYAVKRSSVYFPLRRVGEKPLKYFIDKLRAIDIDGEEDFSLALSVEKGLELLRAQEFGLLKHYLSSAVLSDVSKRLGIGEILSKEIRLVTGGKILGAARTLSLVPLETGGLTKQKSIYDAFSHYDSVRFGDVLVVASEVQGNAYFGDINAHLAIRAGASGAVIGSQTRDTQRVGSLGFPVFALGAFAKDILYEGTVGKIGGNVNLLGTEVSDGDIVFGDHEGVLVFSPSDWAFVKDEALKKAAVEEEIRRQILEGLDPHDAVRDYGDF